RRTTVTAAGADGDDRDDGTNRHDPRHTAGNDDGRQEEARLLGPLVPPWKRRRGEGGGRAAQAPEEEGRRATPLVVSLSNHERVCASIDRLRTSGCQQPALATVIRCFSDALPRSSRPEANPRSPRAVD